MSVFIVVRIDDCPHQVISSVAKVAKVTVEETIRAYHASTGDRVQVDAEMLVDGETGISRRRKQCLDRLYRDGMFLNEEVTS